MVRGNRVKRLRRGAEDNELPPIYELVLKAEEPAHSSHTSHVTVTEGSSLSLRCQVDGVDEKEVQLTRDGVLVDADRQGGSRSLHIASFDPDDHGGLYTCSTSRADGDTHQRAIRLAGKTVLPSTMSECSSNSHKCRNGGICAVDHRKIEICICPTDYVGEFCEDVLVRDYIGMRPMNAAKVGVAAGGCGNVVLIFFTILFAVLFVKERRKSRLLLAGLPPSSLQSQFMDAADFEKKLERLDSRECVTAFPPPPPFTQERLVQPPKPIRHHAAMRTRLDGTSESPTTNLLQ